MSIYESEMTFTEQELKLLRIAHEMLLERRHLFRTLCDKKYDNIGLEGWLQVELIRAYADEEYTVIMKGKVKRGCDLIVRENTTEFLLELRTVPRPNYKLLNDAIEQHQKPDIYLFLARLDRGKLRDYEIDMKRRYDFEFREMDNWVLILVKKL